MTLSLLTSPLCLSILLTVMLVKRDFLPLNSWAWKLTILSFSNFKNIMLFLPLLKRN